MVSPLEDYFNNLDFSPDSSQGEYTAAEKLFMQKYLGVKEEDLPGVKTDLTPVKTAEAMPTHDDPAGSDSVDSGLGYIENTSFEPDTSPQDTAGPAFIEKAVEEETLPEQTGEDGPGQNAETATEVSAEEETPALAQDVAETAAAPEIVSEESVPQAVEKQPEDQAAPPSVSAPASESEPVVESAPEPAPPAQKAQEPPQPAQQTSAPAPAQETSPKPPRPSAEISSVARAEYEEIKEKNPSLEEILKQEERCQMVAFFIGDQEFVVPTMAMQEVIRFEEPIKIPMAPEFVEGVITLRGRVTPVVNLRDMLAVTNKPLESGKCIIICNRRGIQLGFVVEKIHTMYWVPQKDLEWAVEAQLGINADVDFISAVMKSEDGEMLMGMLSVDKIIDYILR